MVFGILSLWIYHSELSTLCFSARAKEEIDDAEEPGIESEMKQLLCSIPGGEQNYFIGY